MTDRRYSIIPARAVTDPTLEGWDLKVLCFLGTHTDKLGWCFLAQGTIAEKIGCGRSTVQRSLARLMEAGLVQTREFNGPRPHACHAYRVIMDHDDPQLDPPEYPVGGDGGDERCPPVGTSGEVLHPRAPVPRQERAPPPAEVPIHTWAHNDPDSGGGGDGYARAREASPISEDAHALADEIATIAGHDIAFLPPRWMCDGPAMRVQMYLDHGWQRPMMIDTAKAIMGRKTDGPPASIRYFEKPFARAHALQSRPAPLPSETAQPQTRQTHETAGHAADWKQSRDNFRAARARFKAGIDQSEDDRGGEDSGQVVRLAPAARHRGT